MDLFHLNNEKSIRVVENGLNARYELRLKSLIVNIYSLNWSWIVLDIYRAPRR